MKEIKTHNQSTNPRDMDHCINPSNQYMDLLEECNGDPKIVEGLWAMRRSGPKFEKGWVPRFDERRPIKG